MNRYFDGLKLWRYVGRREAIRLAGVGPDVEDDYSPRPFVQTNSIFVHLPKTGGVSINRALYGTLGMGHLTIHEYRALFRPRAFREMFKFTFVRNPFDRIHSAYCFLRSGGMGELDVEFDRRVLKNFHGFEHFVLEGLAEDDVAGFWHFLPQTHFLAAEGGSIRDVDFVGRYETLEQDFAHVKARVNPRARLPHLNRTRHKDRQDYRRAYTPEMVDRVAGLYASALDLLGYDFDGPHRPVKLAGSVAEKA